MKLMRFGRNFTRILRELLKKQEDRNYRIETNEVLEELHEELHKNTEGTSEETRG